MSNSKSAPASSGIVRAVLGVALVAWAFIAYAHGNVLATSLTGWFPGGAAVGLAFGLELLALVLGVALIEPFLARLLAAWRE